MTDINQLKVDLAKQIKILNKNKNILSCILVEMRGIKWMLEEGLLQPQFDSYKERLNQLEYEAGNTEDIIYEAEENISQIVKLIPEDLLSLSSESIDES